MKLLTFKPCFFKKQRVTLKDELFHIQFIYIKFLKAALAFYYTIHLLSTRDIQFTNIIA